MLPQTAATIERLHSASTAEIQAAMATPTKRPQMTYENRDGIAIIQIVGVLMKSPDILERLFLGAIASPEVEAAIKAAVADSQVQSLLLVVDSPGGTVSGTASLADTIFAARRKKKIVGFASDKAARRGVLGDQPMRQGDRERDVFGWKHWDIFGDSRYVGTGGKNGRTCSCDPIHRGGSQRRWRAWT